MLRVTVTDNQQHELQKQRRDAALSPLERDRVEIVLLDTAGWSAPRNAAHLGRCGPTVRTTPHRFAAGGPAGLRQQRTGSPPNTARREQVTAALGRMLDQDRTWTAAQLTAALADDGMALSTRQTRTYPELLGARWRRVARTLRHKQVPAGVARATAVLDAVKKRPLRVD